MIVSKAKFDEVNGFDENLKSLSDVELNLKLIDLGYLNIYNPYVYATTFESEEEAKEEIDSESKEIVERRNIKYDRYFSININQEKNNYEIRTDKVEY